MMSIWIGFVLLMLALLALDLHLVRPKSHVIRTREALIRSAAWICLGLLFTVAIYIAYQNHWQGLGREIDACDEKNNDGRSAAIKFATGYIIELSLSVDNLFVIAVLLDFFAVPAMYQRRVLTWGIVGAMILRGGMVGAGVTAVRRFHWALFFFGALLIFAAVKLFFVSDRRPQPKQSHLMRMARSWLPLTERFYEGRFMVRVQGSWRFTPLALALVVVETTDVVFAIDSVPAVFSVTADPFLVFTSNLWAVFGLRSLYFALAALMRQFRLLKLSVAIILVVVGAKMLSSPWSRWLSGPDSDLWLLGLILLNVVGGVVASIRSARMAAAQNPPQPGGRAPADV